MKKAFKLWFHIAGVMFLVVFVDFLLFNDFLMSGYYFYMKEIFIAIFVITIIISVFVIGAYFESFGIVKFKNRLFGYLKLYWSILWRALIIVMPIIALISVVFKGSIGSRIFTIFVEFLAGLPAIYWYLKKVVKNY